MIEEQGRVVAVESENTVWVETLNDSSCTKCVAKSGCSQPLLSQYTSKKTVSSVRVSSDFLVDVGDEVVIGISEASLLKASFLMYTFPLLLMLLGIWLLSYTLTLSDWFLVLLSALLLAIGFGVVKLFEKQVVKICRVDVLRVRE